MRKVTPADVIRNEEMLVSFMQKWGQYSSIRTEQAGPN